MRKLLLSFIAIASILLSNTDIYAQTARKVQGTIQDTTGAPIIASIVKLSTLTDSIRTATNIDGVFTFPSVKSNSFQITVTMLGYKTFTKSYTLPQGTDDVKLELINLRESSNTLNEITITGITAVKIKEDTIEYSAAAYPVREGDAVEEMIKKLPGVEVDKDGNITTQGKVITKIRVNGKDFFGDDVATAIQNLPADIVKSLQVVDDYGDEARLTGIRSEEPEKILNINIAPEKNKGYFAQGTVGKGNEERYSGSVRANTMNGEQQISVNAFLGNTNPRGGSGGNGITDTKTVGLNYRDQWGKKLASYGSYNLNDRDNTSVGTVSRQTVYPTFTRIENQGLNALNNTLRHRLAWNFEYTPDSLNFIKFSPSVSYNSSNITNAGLTNTVITNTSSLRDTRTLNNSTTPNIGGNILFNHNFRKKGRNLSLNASLNYSDLDQDQDSRNSYTNTDSSNVLTKEELNQLIGNNNTTTRQGVRFSYNEPLGKATFLQFSYGYNSSETENVRNVRDIVDSNEVFNNSLSNNYKYQFITNRVGLNFRVVKKMYNYTLGLTAQPVRLEGNDLSRDILTSKESFNWIPNARFVYKFSNKQQVTLNYFGRSNQPSFTQLQPIEDRSNPQNTVVGNPNLDPEFLNSLNINYNQSDLARGWTMFTNLSLNKTQNKIISTRSLVPGGVTQQTTFSNADGFYSVAGNYQFTIPFKERKYTLSYNGGANYSNNVAISNNIRNIGKNFVLNQTLRFRLDFKDVVDLQAITRFSINNTNYSLATSSDTKIKRTELGLTGRTYFWKNLTLGYDFSKVMNKGYGNIGVNQNPILLSLYVEQRFLKGNAATVRLQGFDLFNQNTGISRVVSDIEITDSQYNRLARYFILSFTMKLQKFAGGKAPSGNFNNNGGGGGRSGQGGGRRF